MPEMSAGQRAAGGWVNQARLPLPPVWQELADREIPPPDQSRYGNATTDPLGREGPGWKQGAHGLPVRVKGDRETN